MILKATKAHLEIREREILTSKMANAVECEFEFSSDWDGLSKVVVFRSGDEVCSVSLAGSSCRIPSAATEHAGEYLYIGVCGDNGVDVVLPTIWVNAGYIHPGADPLAVSASDTTLPIYAELREKIGDTDTLTTEGKSSLVEAINELVAESPNWNEEDSTSHSYIRNKPDMNALTGYETHFRYSSLPTASHEMLGEIIQLTSGANAGFFYKCVASGDTPPVYSWSSIDVQPGTAQYTLLYDASDPEEIAENLAIYAAYVADTGAKRLSCYDSGSLMKLYHLVSHETRVYPLASEIYYHMLFAAPDGFRKITLNREAGTQSYETVNYYTLPQAAPSVRGGVMLATADLNLFVADWSYDSLTEKYYQTLSVPSVLPTSLVQVDSSGAECCSQDTGTLTFSVRLLPTTALSAKVAIWN